MSSQYVECTQCHALIEVNITAMDMRKFETTRELPEAISENDRDLLLTDMCATCWDMADP